MWCMVYISKECISGEAVGDYRQFSVQDVELPSVTMPTLLHASARIVHRMVDLFILLKQYV